MAEPEHDPSAETRRLRYRVDALTEQLDKERMRVRALPGILLCLVCLGVPAFHEESETGSESSDVTVGVWDLVNEAQAANNGAVEKFAIALVLLLLFAAGWCLYSVFSSKTLTTRTGYGLGAGILAAWVILLLLVSVSGDEGAIDDLGYRITAAFLVIPFAGALVIGAARSRD